MSRGFLVTASLAACLCWPTPLVAATPLADRVSASVEVPGSLRGLLRGFVAVRVPANRRQLARLDARGDLVRRLATDDAHSPRLPAKWLREARCIHRYEVGLQAFSDAYAWSRRWHLDTGNGFYGGMQFLPGTWRSVGGVGNPALASRALQLQLAYIVWLNNGRRWGGRQWPTTARLCGLK